MLKETHYYLDSDIKDLKKSDIKKLAKTLNCHSDLYYNKEAPVISDTEYDTLLKKLEELEVIFGEKGKFSQKVGEEVTGSTFQKITHTRPMISLGNTYNSEDLSDFDIRVKKNLGNTTKQDIEYCLEYKFDGLGIELIYKNGVFTQAITRGNGIEGEDVTENIRSIKNIPKTIVYKNYLEIRGEVVMPISEFEKLNDLAKHKGTKIFSNPRNAASGSVRMKDATITKERGLQFFAYDIGNFNEYIQYESLQSYHETIYHLKLLDFDISSYFVKFKNIEELIVKIENFGNYKSGIDFEVDGLVLKVNDISLWETIGFTQHHPKYAIAYKFPAEIFTTTIVSVDHQVGRTGTITPAANLEPVNMGGAIIQRATLHNYEETEKLDLRIGDRVFIKRAGEVIPKVISVAGIDNPERHNFEKILPPEYCPSCNTPVQKDGNKVRFICPNHQDCPKQISEQLIYAVGKGGFNIDGLGIRQIEIFLEQKIITDLASIFILETKVKDILALEGFQEKSVENLLTGIEKVKKTSIDIVLKSLGIDGVGKKTAKNLSVLFSSTDDLLNFSHTLKEIENIPDIGPGVAQNVQTFFQNTDNKILFEKLTELLVITYYKKSQANSDNFFYGKSVCITGSFEHNGEKISRDSLAEELEKVGGNFSSGVTKKTNFLLAGEKAGSKLQKAKMLGVKVIDLTFFYKNLL